MDTRITGRSGALEWLHNPQVFDNPERQDRTDESS